jgi:hypothetical protein
VLEDLGDPLAVQLHTAARRYCMERHAHWTARYAELTRGRENRVPYTYSDRDLATFPRYNVLAAILLEVERIVPHGLSLANLRDLLLLAGRIAETAFTKPPNAEISASAMEAEREAFCAFVEAQDDDVLWHVAPLPHRHVLSESAARVARAELARVWGAEGYWYPLEPTRCTDVRAFRRDAFERDKADATLYALIAALPTRRLWEIEETGVIFEIEPASLDLRGGSETFWVPLDLAWIVYVSHESSVTVGGVVLDPLLSAWPGAAAAAW